MYKQLNFFFIVLILSAIWFSSCDSNSSNNPASDDKITTSKESENQNLLKGSLIGNNLDTLWVDSLSFLKLEKKDIAFRFFLDSVENLSLKGWTVKTKLDYPFNPTLNLSRGRKSSLQYKAGYYLGNLLLSKNNITDLQQLVSFNHSKYLLFMPLNPDTVKFTGQVTYEIKLTNDDPHPLVKILTPNNIKTDIITNPSPPGTGN